MAEAELSKQKKLAIAARNPQTPQHRQSSLLARCTNLFVLYFNLPLAAMAWWMTVVMDRKAVLQEYNPWWRVCGWCGDSSGGGDEEWEKRCGMVLSTGYLALSTFVFPAVQAWLEK
ncbi:hypothetical protein NU195Hw_Modified_479t1 [Hortaea werneckii]